MYWYFHDLYITWTFGLNFTMNLYLGKILQLFQPLLIFSSPELKAQVSFSDHLSSVVCLSVCLSVRL